MPDPRQPAAALEPRLAGVIHGPYADASTAGAADLAAETVRYLNHAAAKGGTTDPATIAALTSSLATAAYRLPQLLNAISEWLRAETDAGRIADDHRRSPDQLTARIRAAVTQTADSAEELAAALAAVPQHRQHLRAGVGGPLPDGGERPRPRDHRRDPDGEQPGQRMPATASLPRIRDLGEEIEKVLAAGSRRGRRCHRRAGVPRGRRWLA